MLEKHSCIRYTEYKMHKFAKILLFFGLALVATPFGAWIIFKPKIKPWVEDRIQTELKKSCDTCEFSFDDIFLSWRGPAIENIRFKTRPSGQRLEGEVFSLFAYPRLDSLLVDGEIQLRTVILDQPKITYFDDANNPAPKTDAGFGLPPDVGIGVHNGEFTYIRDVKGTHAELTIRKIQSRIVTEQEGLHARASAQLGDSGNLLLTIEAATKTPLEADIALSAKNQNMKDLSTFFEPNAGVKMEGTLLNGNITSKVAGSHVSTTLKMEFKDFKLKVNSMYDRSDIQTFFTNLAASMALRKNNTDAREKDKSTKIEANREKDETLISFILRSWKEAALKVAQ